MPDVEIEAMRAVSSAMDGLDEDQRGRVLRWAAERFGVTLPGTARNRRTRNGESGISDVHVDEDSFDAEDESEDGVSGPEHGSGDGGFEHFAELYDACGPSSTTDKALVAAYWVQEIAGKTIWTSFDANKILKDLGHGDSSINRTFGKLTGQKPAKVLQIRKSGKSQQARKTFKVTTEGIKSVKAMMRP